MLGKRCDQLGPGDQRGNLEQTLCRSPHVDISIHQASDEFLERDGVSARPAKDVGQRKVLSFRDPVVHCRMIARDDADPTDRAQIDDAQRFRKGPQPEQPQAVQTQVEVGIAILQARERRFREMLDVALDSRRFTGQTTEDGRHDPDDRVRRHNERKRPLDGGRVKRGLGSESGLNAKQRLTNRLDEGKPPRGQLHVAPDPDQQLVVEVLA